MLKNRRKKSQLTPPQILALGFIVIIFIGSFLLSLPAAAANGEALPYINALFTATSATCVNGLTVVDTINVFSVFGQVIIMMLIQVGGLGFMTVATLFALMLRKRISLRDRLILQEALNQTSIEGIVRLIRKIVFYSLTIEATAMVLFTIRWSVDLGWGKAAYFGLFHAISLFNNAGFDLFGQFHSFSMFVDDLLVNVVAMSLVILGGIGFIVMSDVIDYRKNKKLSLHTKVVLSMSGFLILIGAIIIYIFEYTNDQTLGSLSHSGKILASFFQSVSPRSVGASTLDIGELRQATQFFLIILMFIGASPGSVGGGIKTTTFATLIGALLAMIRGKEDIVMFRYRLTKDRIYKAITLTLFALFLVIFATMLLSTTENHHFLMILFEVTSALGSVGLSMGLTPDLTSFGKIVIIIAMFAGRLGPATLAFALQPKQEKELYRYPEGQILIG